MSSAVPDVEEIEDRERDLLDQLPLDAEHIPDTETSAYDARLESVFTTTKTLPVTGGLAVGAGTPLELKTCQRWIEDRHARAGRRRGRFGIYQSGHERLEELGGVYLCAVLDGLEVLAARLIPPENVTEVVSWTASGKKYQTPRCMLAWPHLIPKREVGEG